MAPRIANLPEWRGHLLDDLARAVAASGDERLAALQQELAAYSGAGQHEARAHDVFVPLRIHAGGEILSFLSTRTTFASAADITVAELAIESFYPADELTACAVRR
jgi:hypothetical protein